MSHAVRAGSRLLLMILMVLSIGANSQAQWQIQTITPKPVSSSWIYSLPPLAITFDHQDHPHVAYSVRGLFVSGIGHAMSSASGTGGTWTIATLSLATGDPNVPSNVHLAATDSRVYLTVSSTDPSSSMISAVFDGTSWQTSVPAYNNAVGCGMAADKTNHIYWIANTNTPHGGGGPRCYHLLRLSDDNQIEPASTISGISPALALYLPLRDILQADGDMTFDDAGNMHTVQFGNAGSSGVLFYAKGPAGGPFAFDDNVDPTWMVKTGRPGLAVDAAGNPHIVYTTLWPHYRLYYLTRSGTGWRRQAIDAAGKRNGYVGTFPDILIDSAGTVHVIYTDGLRGRLKHAWLAGSQWQIETIDTVGTQAACTVQTGGLAAAKDSNGGIGVVYFDVDDSLILKYAYLPAPSGTATAKTAGGKQ